MVSSFPASRMIPGGWGEAANLFENLLTGNFLRIFFPLQHVDKPAQPAADLLRQVNFHGPAGDAFSQLVFAEKFHDPATDYDTATTNFAALMASLHCNSLTVKS